MNPVKEHPSSVTLSGNPGETEASLHYSLCGRKGKVINEHLGFAFNLQVFLFLKKAKQLPYAKIYNVDFY